MGRCTPGGVACQGEVPKCLATPTVPPSSPLHIGISNFVSPNISNLEFLACLPFDPKLLAYLHFDYKFPTFPIRIPKLHVSLYFVPHPSNLCYAIFLTLLLNPISTPNFIPLLSRSPNLVHGLQSLSKPN